MSHASTSERTKRTEAIIDEDIEKVFSYVRKGMVHHAIIRLEVLEQHWGEYVTLVKPRLMPPQRIPIQTTDLSNTGIVKGVLSEDVKKI